MRDWFWQRFKELDDEILEEKAILVEEGFKSVESIGLLTDDDFAHFKIPRGHMRQTQFIFKETKGPPLVTALVSFPVASLIS